MSEYSHSQNIPTNSSNLKSKVNKLDVDKLVPAAVDLSKLSDVVKNDVVKKDVYNAKIKNIEVKIRLFCINNQKFKQSPRKSLIC